MKKITLILFSLLIFFLVSCDNEPPKEPGNLYNIKYEKNGGEFILSPFTLYIAIDILYYFRFKKNEQYCHISTTNILCNIILWLKSHQN